MTCDRRKRFTVHTPGSWQGSLAGRLARIEDLGNEVEARLGFRPYQVGIVHTRWSGGRRGDGLEEIVQETLLLPTPKMSDLTGLTVLTTPAQVIEAGQILVSKISGTYTEAQLSAETPSGAPLPASDSVFWEITFLAGCGEGAGTRRRFNVRSAPSYDAERAQWMVTLVKAQENRARSSALR